MSIKKFIVKLLTALIDICICVYATCDIFFVAYALSIDALENVYDAATFTYYHIDKLFCIYRMRHLAKNRDQIRRLVCDVRRVCREIFPTFGHAVAALAGNFQAFVVVVLSLRSIHSRAYGDVGRLYAGLTNAFADDQRHDLSATLLTIGVHVASGAIASAKFVAALFQAYPACICATLVYVRRGFEAAESCRRCDADYVKRIADLTSICRQFRTIFEDYFLRSLLWDLFSFPWLCMDLVQIFDNDNDEGRVLWATDCAIVHFSSAASGLITMTLFSSLNHKALVNLMINNTTQRITRIGFAFGKLAYIDGDFLVQVVQWLSDFLSIATANSASYMEKRQVVRDTFWNASTLLFQQSYFENRTKIPRSLQW